MTPLESLGADDLRAVVAAYREALRAHRESINRLNVYPVPDGDTGTNMGLTVESVLAELDGAGLDMASVCKAIAHGSLMGARGNSGVILSQILRGMAATFGEVEAIVGATFAHALRAASEGAYRAVGEPVEGTILTVVREAADAAEAAAGAAGGASLAEVLEASLSQAGAALERTPQLLEVLRQAGVVDAGGAGFVLLLDAALCVAAGRPVPAPAAQEPAREGDPRRIAPEAGSSVGGSDGDTGPRYEVMYLLEAPETAMEGFREAWAAVGDSIVVVGGEGLWNCHIHADDIGAAIEAGIEVGRPSRIRVTDLAEQVEEERWVREGMPASSSTQASSSPGDTAGVAGPAAATSVVAVAGGEGLRLMFISLGAGAVVAGGQSMNPSTAQLLEAVEACPADQVVVLPNNANIVAVAEQLDGLTAKSVRVVPTTGIAEGLAALTSYDRSGDADANAKAMAAAAAEVVGGEVTQAVRASHCDAGPIAQGDWLGIGPAGIAVVAASAADAAIELLDALATPDHELVTLIEGDGASPDETARIRAWLTEERPALEVEVHEGGQPLYPYLLGVE